MKYTNGNLVFYVVEITNAK